MKLKARISCHLREPMPSLSTMYINKYAENKPLKNNNYKKVKTKQGEKIINYLATDDVVFG